MQHYIYTLVLTALAAAVIELLAPRGDGGRIAAHVRMVAGLFLLVALLNPLKEGLALLSAVAGDGLTAEDLADRLPAYSLPDEEAPDYAALLEDTLSSVGAEDAKEWVLTVLDETFGIPPTGCTVSATVTVQSGDNTLLTVEEVRIALHGPYALENPHPIEDYIAERLMCTCYVTVG